ncbi:PREDICTED: olfactory receptor 6B3-like [Branchiostoma belcheri]|uniref:Olfactory receptor 6B3-like n=1 Tax=Branchiostoma belcheri TaxID=7741 RepID=A0A6P4YCE4_BRABE|nr:PREDICTED: olfactory receptor 6B3-like [Branchiostoma belcheri]
MAEDNSSSVDRTSHILAVGPASRDLQTVYLVISLVVSVGCGLLLIFLVWKKEYLQKPSHYLRCNLAVDDIISTGCLIPVHIYGLFQQDVGSEQLSCSAKGLLLPACQMSMLGTYLMMSVDLYYCICHPLYYHDKVTTKRVMGGILASRVISLILGLGPVVFGGLPTLNANLQCELEPVNSASVAAILRSVNIITLILAGFTILILYYFVLKEARKQQARDENRTMWLFQTKAFKTMAPHAVVFTVSAGTAIFKVAMVRGVVSTDQRSSQTMIVADRVALLLMLTLSSMANPIIYSFRLSEFRKACKELCGLPTSLPVAPNARRQQDMNTVVHSLTQASNLPPTNRETVSETQADTSIKHAPSGPYARPKQLTTRAEVHAAPAPVPARCGEAVTCTIPGQVNVDVEPAHDSTPTSESETDGVIFI